MKLLFNDMWENTVGYCHRNRSWNRETKIVVQVYLDPDGMMLALYSLGREGLSEFIEAEK